MSSFPPCPKCNSEYTYEDNNMYICPECAHEWSQDAGTESTEQEFVVKDAHGTVLQDGDNVTVIKDLKVKGSSIVLKKGTKIKSIRLPEGAGDHEVDCKTDQGAFMLKWRASVPCN